MSAKYPTRVVVAAIMVSSTMPCDGFGDCGVSFAPPVHYQLPITGDGGTGDVVRNLAAGDWNQDGNLDLVVASGNEVTSALWLLMNDGTGSLTALPAIAAGSAPCSVAVGDFDCDGSLDMAVANNDPMFDMITLVLNNGNDKLGTWLGFGLPIYYPAVSQNTIAIADLDGDENLDIATSNGDHGISILVNDGSGAFSLKTSLIFGSELRHIAAADLDADGRVDLVAVDVSAGQVAVLVNDGNLGFTGPSNYQVQNNASDVFLADFDNDGDVDIAVSNNSVSASILYNNGRADFPLSIQVTFSAGGPDVTAADLDGDGDLDLALPRFPNSIDFALKTTNGYCAGGSLVIGESPKAATAVAGTLIGTTVPLDLDSDGDADVVTAATSGDVTVSINETCHDDLDGDGSVGIGDFLLVLAQWGPCPPNCIGDINDDGQVGILDFLHVLRHWGQCP